MRDPARHLPFALLTGMGLVTIVYVSIQAVCIGTLPDLARSERPLADAAVQLLGAPGASLITVGALVSIAGTLNALMFATPRLLFAMGEHRQLGIVFAGTHARFQTPTAAILLTAAATLGVTLFSTFLSALTISTIVRLIAYASTCAALPVLRRRSPVPQPPFAVPAGILVSVLAVALSVWLVSNSPWSEMRVAAAVMLLGLLLYAVSGRALRELPSATAGVSP
jgi:amino acid transporter